MTRLLLLLLLVAACENEEPVVNEVGQDTAPPREKAQTKPVPQSPPTGITQVQAAHDSLREEVEKLEKLDSVPGFLVKAQLQLVNNLLIASNRAIKEDAKLTAMKRLGRMRQDAKRLGDRIADIADQVRRIERLLEDASRGTGRIPAGMTEPEVRDQLGDLQEKLRGLVGQADQGRAAMAVIEKKLNSGVEIKPAGPSLFTRERDALLDLKKRIEKLQAKAK